MTIQTQLRRVGMIRLLKLQGAVALMRDIHNSRLPDDRKRELLDSIVAEILEILPSHVYTVKIGDGLFGEVEEVLPSQIWDLDQLDCCLEEMRQDIGI